MINYANQLTPALQEQQQLLHKQQAIQQCRLGFGILRVWQAVTSLGDHKDSLSDPVIARTLQPATALALAALQCADCFRAAGAVPKAVQKTATQALDVAVTLSQALDVLAELGHTFKPAACVQQFLASAELQKLLLVFIGSLLASLHAYKKGVNRVNISGSGQAAMQLDVPAWHEPVLAQLGASIAEQLKAGDVALLHDPGFLKMSASIAKATGNSSDPLVEG